MKEELLQYVWANRLLLKDNLQTTDNELVEILNFGEWNHSSGPDFFNAKIRIADTIWVGNVEIHCKASDWIKHKHHHDLAYNNVILHVVYEPDCNIARTNGTIIPTLRLRFPEYIQHNYEELEQRSDWLRCLPELNHVNPFIIRFYLSRLVVERLESKTKAIQLLLDQLNNDWHETLYILVARALGANTNSEPFERLTRSLPLRVLAKHKDNLFQLEALLMGQAGFLNETLLGDAYYLDLRKEYQFLSQKFGLKQLPIHNWKFMRMRPASFPTIRIAQFAKLVHQSQSLMSSIQNIESIESLRELFSVSASSYWDGHYHFNRTSDFHPKFLGESTFQNIVINAVVPFLFIFGEQQNKLYLKTRAFELLDELPPERNKVSRHWNESGYKLETAAETQAVIQLKKMKCDQHCCHLCEIGNQLIREGTKQVNECRWLSHHE